jgi:hypothetical protein
MDSRITRSRCWAGGDGDVFIMDRHAELLWLPQRHAAAIKAILARHGLDSTRLRRFVAGTDVFGKQIDGSTVAAQYANLGIALPCANMDRVNEWAEILHCLGDVAGGVKPTPIIHRGCVRLV